MSDFLSESLGLGPLGVSSERLNRIAEMSAERRVAMIERLIQADEFYALIHTLMKRREHLKGMVDAVQSARRQVSGERSRIGWMKRFYEEASKQVTRRLGLHRPEIQVGADVISGAQLEMAVLDEVKKRVELEQEKLRATDAQLQAEAKKKPEAVKDGDHTGDTDGASLHYG